MREHSFGELARIRDLLTVYQHRVIFFGSVSYSDITRRLFDGILFLTVQNEAGVVLHRFNSVFCKNNLRKRYK